MNKVTVIELSEQTGLSRSKIYYLIKKGKLIILNGKINYEDALKVITALKIKKTKKSDEENYRHILNILNSQNIALQKQLDLAYEREKNYLAELASYRQNLLLKPALNSSIDENNSQAGLENYLVDIAKNSRNQKQFESENLYHNESCQGTNKETKSANETRHHPLPAESIQNEMILPESESGGTGTTRQKKEAIEQKDNTLGTKSLTQDNSNQLETPKKPRTVIKILPLIPKYILVTNKHRIKSSKQSRQASTDELITDKDELNGKVHHDQ